MLKADPCALVLWRHYRALLGPADGGLLKRFIHPSFGRNRLRCGCDVMLDERVLHRDSGVGHILLLYVHARR